MLQRDCERTEPFGAVTVEAHRRLWKGMTRTAFAGLKRLNAVLP